MRLQRGQAPFLEVRAGDDAEPLHLAGRHGSDAVEPRDGERGDELGSALGGDHSEAVGLAMVGGELGDELAVTDPGRRGEARLLGDPAADVLRDGSGGAEAAAVLGHVEIGFVEAQRLDQVGIIEEDRPDLLRHRAINVEVRLDENQLRAAALRRHRRHCRADAIFARLV